MSETIVSDLKVSDSVLSPHPFLLSPQSSLLITHSFSELAATLLRDGHSIRFRAAGQSMHPTIRDGETIVVEPIDLRDIKRGDIVLYRDLRGVIAHRVVAIIRTQQRGLSYPQSSILDPQSSIFLTQSSSLSPHVSTISSQPSVVSNPLLACDPRSSIFDFYASQLSPQSSALLPQRLALSPQHSALITLSSSVAMRRLPLKLYCQSKSWAGSCLWRAKTARLA